MQTALRNTLRTTLIQQLKKDARVQAIWVGGSVGRGEEDLYSDLDLYAAVEDGQMEQFFSQLPKQIDLLYPILHYTDFPLRKTSPNEKVWFIYLQEFPVYFRLDIHVLTVSSTKKADWDLRRELNDGELDVVYDPLHLLDPVAPLVPSDKLLAKHLQEKVDAFAWNFALLGNYIRRQSFWQTAEYLPVMRARVLYLLAMADDPANYEDEYERRLRKSLTAEQLAQFDLIQFKTDPLSQIAAAHHLLKLYETASRLLSAKYPLMFPEEFVSRIHTMYTEIAKEDV